MQPHGQQQSNQDAPKALRVFIGSTSLDLTDYRRAAIAACNELGVVPIAMEFFGAADAGATAGSRGNVTRAQGYVGIYAHRYGYIEKGYDKSVTELEFDRAAELELERLCFVVDPKFPWPPDAWEYAHHDALERFKARIDTLIRGRFTTVDDFKAQLLRALVQWRDRNGEAPRGEQATRPAPAPSPAIPAPSLLVGRERDLERIRARLGIGDVTNRRPLTIMRGWPGVGKTTLVSAIARDPAVLEAYPNGVLWASVGDSPDPLKELKAWARALGGDMPPDTPLPDAITRLRMMLRGKRILLIVDDVWDADAALPFRVGDSESATIVTTRLGDVARALATVKDDIYVLERLGDAESLELLSQLAPHVAAAYPAESAALVSHVEGLPLALRVAGRLLEHESSAGFDVRDSFHALSTQATLLAQKAPDDRFDPRTGTTPTVDLLLQQSTARLDAESRRCFACLGAFAPKPATFDIAAIQAVSGMADVKPVVLKLVDRGLLEPIPSIGRFWMHAVLVLHATAILETL
jgi:NB-ARC domain/Domain of unknown function (DUF4062)